MSAIAVGQSHAQVNLIRDGGDAIPTIGFVPLRGDGTPSIRFHPLQNQARFVSIIFSVKLPLFPNSLA